MLFRSGDAPHLKSDEDRVAYLEMLMEHMATSIVLCGDDSNVKFKEIFLGYRTEWIPDGYVGCALSCAPYVVLARKAVPPAGAAALLSMKLSEWEAAVSLP